MKQQKFYEITPEDESKMMKKSIGWLAGKVIIPKKTFDALRQLMMIIKYYDNYDEVVHETTKQFIEKNYEELMNLDINEEEAKIFLMEHIYPFGDYEK